jgi:hypothetical protein
VKEECVENVQIGLRRGGQKVACNQRPNDISATNYDSQNAHRGSTKAAEFLSFHSPPPTTSRDARDHPRKERRRRRFSLGVKSFLSARVMIFIA